MTLYYWYSRLVLHTWYLWPIHVSRPGNYPAAELLAARLSKEPLD